ncbi:hypothetical protein EBR21_05325 [bacterium]|nr:hypothetical protein [bacterium]
MANKTRCQIRHKEDLVTLLIQNHNRARPTSVGPFCACRPKLIFLIAKVKPTERFGWLASVNTERGQPPPEAIT